MLIIRIFLLITLICTVYGCKHTASGCSNKKTHDLEQIKDSGELVVLTLYNSISYFIYRGQEMGLQYEFSEQLAKSLNAKLKIKVARNIPDMIHKLTNGEGDLIAYNLPITKERKDSLLFCGGKVITRQTIVQRAAKPLKEVTDLIGKEVYVKPGKYYTRLANLNNELGGGIIIHKVDNDSITTEDLIAQVAKGEIDYTVSDNDIAQLNKTYYPQLNIDLIISFDQQASWAVRKECVHLAKYIDEWYKNNETSKTYKASVKRYFEISKTVLHTPILSLREGKISIYDSLFKQYADSIGWDWRLLASLAYTESNFDPKAVSWAGAKGLMQLMPATAHAMGIEPGKEFDPEANIKAATKYIAIIANSFRSISDKEEKNKFVLAAYNAGVGHIYDAMALAEKYGKNKNIWDDNVEKYILLKSNEEYFTDPVCKNGYFRGIETYNFVRDVMDRCHQYQQKIH